MDKLCTIDGCSNKLLARGFCSTHYLRWRKYGDPSIVLETHVRGRICSVPGCGRKHDSHGYCETHARQFKQYGTPGSRQRVAIRNLDLEMLIDPTTVDPTRFHQSEDGKWWAGHGNHREAVTAWRCRQCGEPFLGRSVDAPSHCSKVCAGKTRTETAKTNRQGKQGRRYRDHAGYIYVYVPDHPWANKAGKVAEHRLVMEKRLGRYIEPHEQVHHMNGVRNDNRDENLELWVVSQPHGTRHGEGTLCCLDCGSTHIGYQQLT